MLKHLRLHNFRTYLNQDLSFHELQLIIGRNNSGKTSLLSAIRFLASCAHADLSTALTWVPGGILEIKNFTSREELVELSCVCELDYSGEACQFTYELGLRVVPAPGQKTSGQMELAVASEKLSLESNKLSHVVLIDNNGREARLFHEESKSMGLPPYQPKTLAPRNATMLSKLFELETNQRAILFRKFLTNCVFVNFEPSEMRKGWHGRTDLNYAITEDGSNLANVIYQLKNRDEVRYRRVLEHARIVEPELEAINFQPTPDQGIVPWVQLTNKEFASWIGLSSGTLKALGLAYLVELSELYPHPTYPVPVLLLIEEPENGIAPTVVGKFYNLFSERARKSQVIFTSHSPLFINQFDCIRDHVTLLRRKSGRTELVAPIPSIPEDQGPDRLLLAEQYAAELLD